MKHQSSNLYRKLSGIPTFKHSQMIWDFIHDPSVQEGVEDYLKHPRGYAETDKADLNECYVVLSSYFHMHCNTPDGAQIIKSDLKRNRKYWKSDKTIKGIVRWMARYYHLLNPKPSETQPV